MQNPLEELKTWVSGVVEAAKLAVRIEIAEEAASVTLSRLITLNPDPKRKAAYQAALTALGGS